METQLDLKKEYRVSAIIAAAMITAIPLYAAVVEVLRLQNKIFEGLGAQSVTQMRDIFYGLALIVLLVIRKLRQMLLKKDAQDDARTLVNKLKIATVITYALCEMPAILGFVLFLAGEFYREFYLLLVSSLIAMIVYFPKYTHWEVWVDMRSIPS